MTRKMKRPSDALQRVAGAGMDYNHMTQCQTYSTSREIQTRYLRRRCGLDEQTARLVAALHFGEDR